MKRHGTNTTDRIRIQKMHAQKVSAEGISNQLQIEQDVVERTIASGVGTAAKPKFKHPAANLFDGDEPSDTEAPE